MQILLGQKDFFFIIKFGIDIAEQLMPLLAKKGPDQLISITAASVI